MDSKDCIFCIGEVLWDSMPMGLFLGGAPLNVTFHLNQLEEPAQIISRVGNDRLGQEALRRIVHKGLQAKLIQQDEELETGFVEVELDHEGNPEYDIIQPVAWDNLKLSNQTDRQVKKGWAVVYGSLAMRDSRSRSTILSLINKDVLKVLDINLRKPFYSKEIIHEALLTADILKFNNKELQQLISWFSLPTGERKAIELISEQFGCKTIAVTKGGAGALLFHKGRWVSHSGFTVKVKDAVGAGDAFLAALLQGLRAGKEIKEILLFANAAGAFVASNFGATPEYTPKEIEALANRG